MALAYFAKLNKMLDEGWTMSNINCPDCNGSIMYSTQLETAQCVKCDKKLDVVIQKEEPEEVEEKVQYTPAEPKPDTTREDGSKKIGEYLLSGWCMMESSCSVCFQPHMKSRQGELICVNCGPVNVGKKVQKQPEEESLKEVVMQESKIPTKNIDPFEEVMKEEKPIKISSQSKTEQELSNTAACTMSETNLDKNFSKKQNKKEKCNSIENTLGLTSVSSPDRDNKEMVQMNGTLKACVDKIASIELKKLQIIEKEMDKILEGESEGSDILDKMNG